MWNPDPSQLPRDHDPWPWRIGVAVWGIGILVGPFFMDGMLAIILSGFIALIVGAIVHDHRKRRR